MKILCLWALALAGVASHAAVSDVQILVGGRINLSGEGTLIQATNLGTTTSPVVAGVGTFTGDTGTDGIAGSATLATVAGGALAAADTGSAIDNLFFTETYNSGGTGMKLTFALPDTGDFLVEILHGEPRGQYSGTFTTATLGDTSGTVAVPTFTIGNNIANQSPPPDADWVIIRARVSGVSSFTYTLPNSPVTGRGASISGFQVRRVVSTFEPTDTEPFISEFSAAGNTTYKDENGESPDWIEIYNPTAAAINLAGWHLTNAAATPNRWTFPSVSIPRGNYLVVFASGKNRAVAGSTLHTDFKLPAGGGYLALTKPDGSVVHSFPAFPGQTDGFGYGVAGLARSAPSAFFQPATPGGKNGPGISSAIAPPVFSTKRATFTTTQGVTLSTTFPGGQIRYTTNGAVPTVASTLYTGPLSFSTTTQLRAAVFEAVGGGGAVDTGFYTKLSTTSNLGGIAAPSTFESNLPVLVVENFGANGIPGTSQPMQFAQLAVFEPDPATGRTRLNRTPDKALRAGLRVRGQSSAGFPKQQYKLETWNEANTDKDESLLGLPAESDWVLGAPYADESLLRNALVLGLGSDLGLPTARTRFCEVFINTNGGSLESADYAGVYLLTESLKISKNRLDLAKVNDFADNDGGYLLRHEAGVATETRLAGWTYAEIHDPGVLLLGQQSVIGSWVNNFNTALRTPNFADPTTGYAAWADPESFAAQAVANEFTRSQDGYVRSTYFYKDRSGKLLAGPLWDFDLTFGNTCCFNAHLTGVDPDTGSGWQWDHGYNRGGRENGLGDSAHFATMARLDWTRLMWQDVEFKQRFIDRWQHLRQGPLSNVNFPARVNAIAADLSDHGAATSPQQRNFLKWNTLGSITTGFQSHLPANLTNAAETWAGHVDYVKTWAAQRSSWMDSQFTPMPALSPDGGQIAAGALISGTAANPIYVTTDGTDPRLTGGASNSAAQILAPNAGGPAPTFTLNATARVRARAKTAAGAWSAAFETVFLVGQPATPATLIVSELNYHPANPTVAEQLPDGSLTEDDFEFIELKNVDASPLELSGAGFVDGIEYTFPLNTTLAPGGTLILASNTAAFARRYGPGVAVFGQFAGHLADDGEHLELRYPFGAAILSFTYSDAWHAPTDGGGYSMVARNQHAAPADASVAAAWAISSQLGGSPGGSTDDYAQTFESWLHYHFTPAEQATPGLAGPEDDPDRDGRGNLLEYALGTDPRSPSSLTQNLIPAQTTDAGLSYVTLTYRRAANALDLQFTPAFSEDLHTWSNTSVPQGVPTTFGDGTESVTVRAATPLSTGGKGFARVLVVKP
jgi:hypothetical protein